MLDCRHMYLNSFDRKSDTRTFVRVREEKACECDKFFNTFGTIKLH